MYLNRNTLQTFRSHYSLELCSEATQVFIFSFFVKLSAARKICTVKNEDTLFMIHIELGRVLNLRFVDSGWSQKDPIIRDFNVNTLRDLGVVSPLTREAVVHGRVK